MVSTSILHQRRVMDQTNALVGNDFSAGNAVLNGGPISPPGACRLSFLFGRVGTLLRLGSAFLFIAQVVSSARRAY